MIRIVELEILEVSSAIDRLSAEIDLSTMQGEEVPQLLKERLHTLQDVHQKSVKERELLRSGASLAQIYSELD